MFLVVVSRYQHHHHHLDTKKLQDAFILTGQLLEVSESIPSCAVLESTNGDFVLLHSSYKLNKKLEMIIFQPAGKVNFQSSFEYTQYCYYLIFILIYVLFY